MPDPMPVPCLLGPTACGKTDVAVALARRTDGEIVSADAFAVYRGMEILSAAPAAPADVPHHLVAFLPPTATWSAAAFLRAADRTVDDVRARGRVPWIVGGTALYLRAWLKGFGAPVPRDPALRKRLSDRLDREGPEALHRALAALDARRATEIHPHDARRVVRALEIVAATGRPASDQREQWRGPDRRPARLFGLRRSREDLDRRIARRTDAMFQAGVVEEARRLLAGPISPEAAQVLGLDLLGRLLAGDLQEREVHAMLVRRTRRFARKQETFFRSFKGVHWFDLAPEDDDPEGIAVRIEARRQALAEEEGTLA